MACKIFLKKASRITSSQPALQQMCSVFRKREPRFDCVADVGFATLGHIPFQQLLQRRYERAYEHDCQFHHQYGYWLILNVGIFQNNNASDESYM